MPIYEYQCNKCRKIHEIWQKMSDKPADKCPDCSGPLHKLVSLSSFQLKGGGWYVDGYSSSSDKKNNEQKSSNSAESSKVEKKTTDVHTPEGKNNGKSID